MSEIDNRSFIHVRMNLLIPKGERRHYSLTPVKGGTMIHNGADSTGKRPPHSLRSLYEKLSQDGDTIERYTLAWDAEANEIRLGFRPLGQEVLR